MANNAVEYALRFIGRPYKWGGDDPMEGFDCSGFALEVLKSVGAVADNFDTTAQYLAKLFPRVDTPDAGALVFFGNGDKAINHVGICLGRDCMVEAGGGTSKTTNLEAAMRQNAFIRIRPITRRKDIVCYCDPFLHKED